MTIATPAVPIWRRERPQVHGNNGRASAVMCGCLLLLPALAQVRTESTLAYRRIHAMIWEPTHISINSPGSRVGCCNQAPGVCATPVSPFSVQPSLSVDARASIMQAGPWVVVARVGVLGWVGERCRFVILKEAELSSYLFRALWLCVLRRPNSPGPLTRGRAAVLSGGGACS